MKKPLVLMLVVLAIATMVAIQGAVPAYGQAAPTIKDPAEYNAYVNASGQTNAAQKASALEAFLQTYPNSVMKQEALVQLMSAYQQAGDAAKMIDAANRVLAVNPNNVRALAVLTFYYRATTTPQNLDQNLAMVQKYAEQGEQALHNMTKPDGMTDADFTKFHNELSAIFEGGLGFVALQKKDNATAAKDFKEAISHESQPSIADVYPLAQADLQSNPMNPEGFWYAVKASQMAQGAGQQQILDYAKKKYIRYHGKDEGWDELVTQAKASTSITPPQGFTVTQYIPPSPAEQAADLVKKKDPKQMSFAEWELVLSSGNQQAADTVWNAIKDKAVKLGANVISSSASKVQLAGSDDDIEAKKADIELTMGKPLPAKLVPAPGTLMTFQGTVSSYTPNPFMMTMTDGILLDKNGNPVSTAAPSHPPAHRKPSQ